MSCDGRKGAVSSQRINMARLITAQTSPGLSSHPAAELSAQPCDPPVWTMPFYLLCSNLSTHIGTELQLRPYPARYLSPKQNHTAIRGKLMWFFYCTYLLLFFSLASLLWPLIVHNTNCTQWSYFHFFKCLLLLRLTLEFSCLLKS